MADISEIVGEKVFAIVPLKAAHPFDSEADGVAFTLDDTSYLAFEDPNDGYRSSLGSLLSFPGPLYSLGGSTYPEYLHEKVICGHVATCEYGDGADILEVRSAETGAVIFRVGTTNVDDSYPSFVNEWMPSGLSANAKERLA